jgi:hypothetical protein
MAVTDFANHAAAVPGVGCARRPSARRRLVTSLCTKRRSFARPEHRDRCFAPKGSSDVDQATAVMLALNALDAVRRNRYGGSPGRASGSSESPGTTDVH